jgi:ABC-type transporter Mla MlaB component
MSQEASRERSLFMWSAARRMALDVVPRPVAPPPVRTARRAPTTREHPSIGEARRRIAAPARDMTHSEHVKELAGECRRLIRRPDTATLVIDLADVEQADTKLVACLVGVYRLASARAVSMEMILPRVVQDLVAVCRLEPLIEQTRPRREPTGPYGG